MVGNKFLLFISRSPGLQSLLWQPELFTHFQIAGGPSFLSLLCLLPQKRVECTSVRWRSPHCCGLVSWQRLRADVNLFNLFGASREPVSKLCFLCLQGHSSRYCYDPPVPFCFSFMTGDTPPPTRNSTTDLSPISRCFLFIQFLDWASSLSPGIARYVTSLCSACTAKPSFVPLILQGFYCYCWFSYFFLVSFVSFSCKLIYIEINICDNSLRVCSENVYVLQFAWGYLPVAWSHYQFRTTLN